jgi:16S rRNA (guanine966-N2)-methyltransferase
MSDKARGGLFNTLGDIKGLSVLDAFAGSGALSIEAISRGAKHSLAIDIDKDAVTTINKNIEALALEERIKAINTNVLRWSQKNRAQTFDLVLCDPPYDAILESAIEKLIIHLKPSGTLVLSWPGKLGIPLFKGLKHVANNSYGDAQLIFYKSA